MDPHLVATLGGLGLGAGAGAIAAGHGHRLHGAISGGLTGGLLGSMIHEPSPVHSYTYTSSPHEPYSSSYGASSHPGAGAPPPRRNPFDDFYESAHGFGSDHPGGFSDDFWEKVRQRGQSAGAGAGADPRRAPSTYAPPSALHDEAPWLKNVTTKANAKSAFRAQARASHPDAGGTDEAMQRVNDQWERAQNHPDFEKLSAAFARGAQDALERLKLRREAL